MKDLQALLYSFGHGLSYANFQYRELTISSDTMRPGESITVTVWLEPGEEKEVSFTVDESKLVMWTAEGKFDTVAGLFSLYTGYADHLAHEKQFRLVK